jgi:hypothetical protein
MTAPVVDGCREDVIGNCSRAGRKDGLAFSREHRMRNFDTWPPSRLTAGMGWYHSQLIASIFRDHGPLEVGPVTQCPLKRGKALAFANRRWTDATLDGRIAFDGLLFWTALVGQAIVYKHRDVAGDHIVRVRFSLMLSRVVEWVVGFTCGSLPCACHEFRWLSMSTATVTATWTDVDGPSVIRGRGWCGVRRSGPGVGGRCRGSGGDRVRWGR